MAENNIDNSASLGAETMMPHGRSRRRSHRRSVGWIAQMIHPSNGLAPRRVLSSLSNALNSVRISNHVHHNRYSPRRRVKGAILPDKPAEEEGHSPDTCANHSPDTCASIPSIFCDCLNFLRSNGLQTEGIFRVSGDQEIVKALKERYDSGETINLKQESCDVHDVASLLKLHITEHPLIPEPYYRQMYNLWETLHASGDEEKAAALASALKQLPIGLQARLGLLVQFLYIVSCLSAINRMSTEALSVVFAPVVFVTPDDTPLEKMLIETKIAVQASKLLIENAELVQVPDEVLVDLLPRSPSMSSVEDCANAAAVSTESGNPNPQAPE